MKYNGFILINIHYLNIKTNLFEILFSFGLYWLFVGITNLIPGLHTGNLTFYLLIPAGVKIFAILIYRIRGAIGIFLGVFSRLLLAEPDHPWTSWLLISLTSIIVLFLVIEFMLQSFGVHSNLANLNYYQLVALVTATSVINGFLAVYGVDGLGMGAMNETSETLFHKCVVAVMGNFAASAIFVCIAVLLLKNKIYLLNLINGKNTEK